MSNDRYWHLLHTKHLVLIFSIFYNFQDARTSKLRQGTLYAGIYRILYRILYIYIEYYVELSFGFRARDDSSLAFAIMMFNKGCIYIKLYFFTKFDK